MNVAWSGMTALPFLVGSLVLHRSTESMRLVVPLPPPPKKIILSFSFGTFLEWDGLVSV
jgi:hypothetical protein